MVLEYGQVGVGHKLMWRQRGAPQYREKPYYACAHPDGRLWQELSCKALANQMHYTLTLEGTAENLLHSTLQM